MLRAQIHAPTGATTATVGRALPGHFIVTYRDGVVPLDAGARAATHGAYLVGRHERLGIAILAATNPAALQSEALSADARSQLMLDPDVQSVVEDRVVSAHLVEWRAATFSSEAPDALYNSSEGWAVKQVGGFGSGANDAGHPGPWNATRGEGVRIAILDSGVDASHLDIAPNLALNLSKVDQSVLPSPCDDGTPADQQGHGTWTASLAAGALGSGTGLVAGVAPAATILNIKVLERMPSAYTSATDPTGCTKGQASGLLSWVIAGIEEAVAQRADIISMSLGTLVDITTGDGAGLKATFDHVTHAAAQAGAVLIAAAGNDGFNLGNVRYVELPAQSRDVLAIVASTNPACAENLARGASCVPGPITLPYYTNLGTPLNALAAPGGSYPPSSDLSPGAVSGWIRGACSSGLPSTLNGPPSSPGHSFGCFGLGHVAYVQAMGTSAAAPLAAGAAALIRGAHPTWDAATVVAAMRFSATPIPGASVSEINAAAAIASTGGQTQHSVSTLP